MASDISKELKKKTDAMLRLRGQSQKPVVIENTDGSYYAPEVADYTAVLKAGQNITITTSGNEKIINAVMGLLEGDNIEISIPDIDGNVTITGTVKGKSINIADFTGKDGYVLSYDETADQFILVEIQSSYSLPQATETILGGIKAKAKTTETSEISIDTTTGKLYGPSAGQAENGLPIGGTAGQILSKIDGTDYNAEWVDAPSGGSKSYMNIAEMEEIVNSGLII